MAAEGLCSGETPLAKHALVVGSHGPRITGGWLRGAGLAARGLGALVVTTFHVQGSIYGKIEGGRKGWRRLILRGWCFVREGVGCEGGVKRDNHNEVI